MKNDNNSSQQTNLTGAILLLTCIGWQSEVECSVSNRRSNNIIILGIQQQQ